MTRKVCSVSTLIRPRKFLHHYKSGLIATFGQLVTSTEFTFPRDIYTKKLPQFTMIKLLS